jgi:hypothetical protein
MNTRILVPLIVALAGCADAPMQAELTERSGEVIAVNTAAGAPTVEVETGSTIGQRAKQGATIGAVPMAVAFVAGPYSLVLLGVGIAGATVGAAAGVVVGALELVSAAPPATQTAPILALVRDGRMHPRLDGCFATGMTAASPGERPSVRLDLRWESFQVVAVPGTESTDEPRVAIRSRIAWVAHRPGEMQQRGTLSELSSFRTIEEWTADDGAVAQAELHEACARLAGAVRAQLDPAQTARLANAP